MIRMIALSIGLTIAVIFNLTGRAGAEEYVRKAVTAVETVVLTSPKVKLNAQQDSLLREAFSRFIMKECYDEVPLRAKDQAQIRARLANEVVTVDGGDGQLTSIINELVAPALVKVMEATLKWRTEKDNPHFDEDTFIRLKAKDLGITVEDFERMMKCGYLYVPFLSELKSSGSGKDANFTLKGGTVWYYLDIDAKPDPVLVYRAKVSSTGMTGLWSNFLKDKKLTPESEAFCSAAKRLAENVYVKSTTKIPDIRRACTITEIVENSPGFRLGFREGLILDDRYAVIDRYEDQSGNEHEKRIGFFMVKRVTDNRDDRTKLSWGRPVIGSGNMAEGMMVREIPKTAIDLSIRTTWRPLAFDSLRVSNLGTTYFSLEDTTSTGVFTIDVDLQMNIGRKLGISQFFLDLGAGYGYAPVKLNLFDNTEINHGTSLAVHGGLMKRIYLGRSAFVIGGDFVFERLSFKEKVNNTEYMLYRDFISGIFRAGFDYALSSSLNIGLRGGYTIAEKSADWKLKINDEKPAWYEGQGVAIDHDGPYASLVFSYALPSLFWSPF